METDNTNDLEAVTTAVLLLVSGLGDTEQDMLIMKVFHGRYITLPQHSRAAAYTSSINSGIHSCLGIADGSSGLGASAASSLHQSLQSLLTIVQKLQDIIDTRGPKT